MKNVYRTYIAHKDFYGKFHNLSNSWGNKPIGGLWGCRGTEWDDWCTVEDFREHSGYYEWQLKPNCKVFRIEHVNDFFYLVKNYNNIHGIDYVKLAKHGYDAVELTEEVNNMLHFTVPNYAYKSVLAQTVAQDECNRYTLTFALNSWDVPSICVFYPEKNVIFGRYFKK